MTAIKSFSQLSLTRLPPVLLGLVLVALAPFSVGAEPKPPVLFDVSKSISNLSGDARYLGLTPARLAKIKANVETGKWEHWRNFAAKMEAHLDAGPATRRNMQQAFSLYVATGHASNELAQWWSNAYVVATEEFLRDTLGNAARQNLAAYAYSFAWASQHVPNFWSPAQVEIIRTNLTVAISDNLHEWEERIRKNQFIRQDTDYVIAAANIFQAHAELGIYDPAIQARLETARAVAVTNEFALPRIFNPDYGTFAGGKTFESNSYAANTPRFFHEWSVVTQDRGLDVFDENHAISSARVIALMSIPDPVDMKYKGFWAFNDANENPRPEGYVFGGKKTFRNINFMYGSLMNLPPESREHRAIKWLIEHHLDGDTDGFSTGHTIEHGTPRIFNDDPNITPLPLHEAALPTSHYAGGSQPLFLSRRDWNEGAPQFFAMTWLRWAVDHWGGASNHYELFNRGVSITRYQNTNGMFSTKGAHNIVYIENNGTGTDGFSPVGQPSASHNATPAYKDPENNKPEVIGLPSANSDYATYAAEASSIWNRDGRVRQVHYVKQNTRRILNLWGDDTKLTLVYDRVITDPTEEDDGITGIRKIQRLTRLERPPVLRNGWYSTAAYDGQESHFKELLASPTTTVVNESDYGSSGPAYRKWHISDVLQQVDSQMLGLHAYGDAGSVTLPVVKQLDVNAGNAVAYELALNGGKKYVVVVNQDPLVPIEGTVQVSGVTIGSGTTVVALDFDGSKRFDVSTAGGGLTIEPGSDFTPGSDRVMYLKY